MKYYHITFHTAYFFCIVAAVAILKILCTVIILKKHRWCRMGFMGIVRNLEGISNVAQLLSLIVDPSN